jgi:hypothetical protein
VLRIAIENHKADFVIIDSLSSVSRNSIYSENDTEYARPILELIVLPPCGLIVLPNESLTIDNGSSIRFIGYKLFEPYEEALVFLDRHENGKWNGHKYYQLDFGVPDSYSKLFWFVPDDFGVWRKGHWKRVAIGVGREERAWRWIRPTIVGIMEGALVTKYYWRTLVNCRSQVSKGFKL